MSTRYDELTKILGTDSAGTPTTTPAAEEQKQTLRRDELFSLLGASEPVAPATADTGASATQSSPVLEKPKQETLQPTTPQSATPSTSSGAYAPPSPQGGGMSAEQIQQGEQTAPAETAQITQSQAQAELDRLKPVLEEAKQYENEMGRYRSGAGQDESLYLRALTRRDSLLKKYGYSSVDELNKAVMDYTLASGNELSFMQKMDRAGYAMDESLKNTVLSGDWWKKVLSGGAEQWAGSQLNAAGTTAGNIESIGKEGAGMVYENELRARNDWATTLEEAKSGVIQMDAEGIKEIENIIAYYDNTLLPSLRSGVQAYETLAEDSAQAADEITAKGQQNTEKAKEGLGWGGQLAVDLLTQGTMIALDKATGAPNISMFTRGLGSGAQEARQSGGTAQEQIGYGAAVGTVEVLTNKLFDGLAGIYGKGAADELVEATIAKLAKSRAGQASLRLLASGFNEGIEEILSDAINPLLRTIYSDKSIKEEYSEEKISQWLYDGLVGAIMGTGLTAVNPETYALNTGNTQTAGQEQTGAEAQAAEVAGTEETPQQDVPTAPITGGALQETQTQATGTAQDAQRATPQAETPPTTQNAAQAASGELNLRDEGNVSSSDYDTQRRESLMFSEAPQEAVHNTDSFDGVTANDDFQNRDFNDVGNQKIKAYMYENPEVKPFFQFEAEAMLNDLKNSVKGERFYNSQLAYDSGNEYGWTGNKRLVSDDIAVLLDYGYSYEEIEKGLKAIIEDDGRENNACSKRIEFLLNDRLMDGYTDWQSNEFVPPNQEYRNMILEKQINAYSKEAFEEYLKNAERYAPKDAKINSNGQSNPQGADTVRGFSENVATQTAAPAAFNQTTVQREQPEGANAVRGFSENIATDSAMEEALRREFEQNPEMYTRLANKDTLKKAQDIFTQGLDKARSELERAIGAAQSGQKFPPEMVPLSRMVANELTRQGELTAARKIISDVAAELTSAGQLGQAGAILRNADPMTVLNTLQKSIDQINAEMAKKFGKRNPWKAELTAEEIKQISETDFSQDGAFEAIQQQIAERLGREMPATLLEKLREIRKVGMLANPKTQVKNFAGNVPLAGERKIAEKLSGGLQELAVKAGIMAKEEQTRTLRVSQESKDLAKSVYKNNIDRITRKGNKGELRGILRDTRTYFNKGLLQKGIEKATGHQLNDAALDYVRRFTYDMMEKGDAPFVKSAFIDSLAQYCEAQGIKSENAVTETAYSYALDQAMAATFKDASALANLLNSIKDKAGIAGEALDVLFPFTTTPINIGKEFAKYSPLGYLQLLNAKGKSAAEVIDIISRATTGSAVVAAGAILRSLGFITGAADDDKDKAAADKAAGISPYSILGKYSYEWMQPTGSALAMGASIYDAAKDGSSLIETLSNGIISAGDAYLEQSFYKDIIDLFKGYGSPTENMIRELLTGTASQFIPTIVGATARTIDPTVRTSYSGGNIIDDILAQAKVKTPGISKSAPASVNVRGEEIQRGNLAQRILDNFIFPWTTNRNGGEENAVDEAIDEVYAETGDKTIFRRVSPYKVSYKNETYQMTGEEREQFQKTQGQVHDDILQQIIAGALWQEMDNDAKVKTMQLANEYALDAAKRELVESRGNEYSSDWDDEAELPDVGDYLAAKTTLKAAQDSKDYTLLDALVDTVSEQQKAVQEKLNKDFSILDELIYGKEHGVDAETIYTAKTEADANGNGKISQEELWYYLGLQKNMPEETKDVLWDILTTGKTGYSQYAEKQK